MKALDPVSQEEFIRSWLQRRIAGEAQCFGCTVHCRFEVAIEFHLKDLSHHVYLYHRGGRDRQEVVIPKVNGRETVEQVIEAATPWLRGLHRFRPDLGIK